MRIANNLVEVSGESVGQENNFRDPTVTNMHTCVRVLCAACCVCCVLCVLCCAVCFCAQRSSSSPQIKNNDYGAHNNSHGLHDAPGAFNQSDLGTYTGGDNIFVMLDSRRSTAEPAPVLDFSSDVLPADHMPGLHW